MTPSDASPEPHPALPDSSFVPFTVVAGDVGRGLLLLCDHAENRLPPEYGTLGLPASEFQRHIAYDPGAAAVTRGLATRLGAPAVLSTFSRLLIDANRGADDPTLIMRLSDRSIIPGNAAVDARERASRVARFHAPYHTAIATTIERSLADGVTPAIVSIHSFTPVWRGALRPWHAGILWSDDPRLATPLIEALRMDASLVVGDNEPYSGALANDTLDRHATRRGLASVLIEIRQDLISDDPGVAGWVDRLAPIIERLNRQPGLHVRLPEVEARVAP